MHKILYCTSSSFPRFASIIAGISISIHSRTVVANSNNSQTHPVCNLLSTNEIIPSENIFNNNVMQNGISRIVKIGRFYQFLLKCGRLQPHYITQGYNICRYTPIQPGTEELILSSRNVHPPVSHIWWEAGFFDQSEGN